MNTTEARVTAWVREEVVRDWLFRESVTMTELARRVGVTRVFLSRIVNGEQAVGPSTRRRLMAALGVTDFDALFDVVPAADANGHTPEPEAESAVAV